MLFCSYYFLALMLTARSLYKRSQTLVLKQFLRLQSLLLAALSLFFTISLGLLLLLMYSLVNLLGGSIRCMKTTANYLRVLWLKLQLLALKLQPLLYLLQ